MDNRDDIRRNTEVRLGEIFDEYRHFTGSYKKGVKGVIIDTRDSTNSP